MRIDEFGSKDLRGCTIGLKGVVDGRGLSRREPDRSRESVGGLPSSDHGILFLPPFSKPTDTSELLREPGAERLLL